MSEHQGSGMVTGLLIGAVVGAGLALLLAPASGSETRRRLKAKAQDFGNKANALGESARDTFDEVGNTVREGTRELGQAMKDGRDAFQKTAEEPVTPGRRV